MRAEDARSNRLACIAGCIAALVLTTAAPSAAQHVDAGPILVTQARASSLSVAAGEDGTMTFLWVEQPDITSTALRDAVRHFNNAGEALSAAMPTGTGGASISGFYGPDIAANPGGGYVISSLRGITEGVNALNGLQLDAAATPSGAPFEVQHDPNGLFTNSVAALASGPVFVWRQNELWSRRVDPSGTPLEAPRMVDPNVRHVWLNHDVAALPGGGYVVVWHDSSLGPSHGQIFAADGVPVGNPFVIAGLSVRRVAVSAAGGILVAGASVPWGQILMKRFSLDALPLGPTVRVDQSGTVGVPIVDLALDPQGNALVVFGSFSNGNFSALRARFVSSSDQTPMPEVLIAGPGGAQVRVARLTNNRFVVAWSTFVQAWASLVSMCGSGSPTCGNGSLQIPCEQCDNGAANSDTAADACRTNCMQARCGDDVIDSGEECDDGGRVAGDGCDHNCLVQACGSGRLEGAETCDDGNLVDDDGCDSNCQVTGCGNGQVTAGEECDDFNERNGDGCDTDCLIEECGGGRIESDEECDDGNLTDGDGCDSNCTTTSCGNAIVTPPEECDDAGNLNGDGCDQLCLIEQCGNGRVEGNEPCDDGNAVNGDGCETDCTASPQMDALVDAIRPVRMSLPPDATSTSKTVSLRVRNVDAPGPLQVLRVTAAPGTCPADAIAVGPDFDASSSGVQDTVALLPGQRATGRLRLTIQRGSFSSVDRNAPHRCAIELSVGLANPIAVDVAPWNSRVAVTVDIVDRGAPSGDTAESHVVAAKPVKLRIPAALLAVQRNVTVRARSNQSAAAFAFQVSDGDCPSGTVTLTSQDPAGSAVVSVRASRAFFTTPNRLSPARCTATVTSSSPVSGNDPTNDTTPLVIDVSDENDQ